MLKSISRYAIPEDRRFWSVNCAIVFYTLGVQFVDAHAFPSQRLLQTNAALLTSAIVGLLLVLRTNSAYERWWEARKLLGVLVNDIRNLSIKCKEFAQLDETESAVVGALLVEFVSGLTVHLRSNATKEKQSEGLHRTPINVAQLIYRQIHKLNQSGRLSDIEMLMLDNHAKGLMDAYGGCERIKKSPLVGSYKLMLWTGTVTYFLIIPWLLVPIIDNLTILPVTVAAYFVTALEFFAEEVEEPFGRNANDLPLDDICESVAASVSFVLRECDLVSECRPSSITFPPIKNAS